MNLDETRLTTGRYPEVIASASRMLAAGGLDLNERMTLQVLLLSAQVLQGDDPAALQTLADFERFYSGQFHPANRWHNWVYDGTLFYLEKRVPVSDKTSALLRLVQAVNGASTNRGGNSPPAIGQEVFDNLKRALPASRSYRPQPRARDQFAFLGKEPPGLSPGILALHQCP